MLPKDKRKYIYSIYAFARQADDYADETNNDYNNNNDRIKLIDEWEKKLPLNPLKGTSNNQVDSPLGAGGNNPVFIALKQTIQDCRIDVQLLRDLLKAFRQDVVKSRYKDLSEVLDYCKNSANPVGRMVLEIFDIRDEKLFLLSDKICTGLQLANFWQDVLIDLKKDRIYIPIDEMNNFGYSEEKLRRNIYDESFKGLMNSLVSRTEELFKEGKKLISYLPKSLRQEIKLVWLGGTEILNQLKKIKYNIFEERPKIGFTKKIALLTKSYIK